MESLTRQQALEAGKTRYFTGKPCPRGHVAERMVSIRACVACLSEKAREWRQANPSVYNARKRAYIAANIDKVKAWKSAEQKRNRPAANIRSRRWRAAHLEQTNANSARWSKENPGKRNARAARYRAAQLRATPKWADRSEIQKVYDLAARFRSLGCDFHVDHVIPLQGKNVCGLHVHNNLEIIEARTNRSKSNQLHS